MRESGSQSKTIRERWDLEFNKPKSGRVDRHFASLAELDGDEQEGVDLEAPRMRRLRVTSDGHIRP